MNRCDGRALTVRDAGGIGSCPSAAAIRQAGYRRIYLRLRCEGWQVNRKRIYRLYRQAGLAVRRRKRKRIGPFERKPLPRPTALDDLTPETFAAAAGPGTSPRPSGGETARRLKTLTKVEEKPKT